MINKYIIRFLNLDNRSSSSNNFASSKESFVSNIRSSISNSVKKARSSWKHKDKKVNLAAIRDDIKNRGPLSNIYRRLSYLVPKEKVLKARSIKGKKSRAQLLPTFGKENQPRQCLSKVVISVVTNKKSGSETAPTVPQNENA